MEIGNRFKPHPNLIKVYHIYLLIVATLLFLSSLIPLLVIYYTMPNTWIWAWPYTLIPPLTVVLVSIFISYWIRRYYDSIWYTIAEDGVAVERGVWWKMKHFVPYSRIMSVDIIQGPISRRFRIGSVFIYTAGYTGPSGGKGKRAEAEIIGIDNFLEMRDLIINMVKGRPLFTIERGSIEQKILEEVERIRKILEKQYSKI